MTVHGAKGLEAPVVILADATGDPTKLGRTPVAIEYDVKDAGVVPFLRPRKEERLSPFAEMIEVQEILDLQEHWRLLYVAMTRAADRLIVSGVAPAKERPPNSWHRAVEQGLVSLGATEEEGKLVYGSSRDAAARKARPQTTIEGISVPSWAVTAAPVEARPTRPLAPSMIAPDTEGSAPPSEAMRAAARRGTIIHQLLERLVAVDVADRESTALRWLERSAGVAVPSDRQEIASQVCSILSDARYSALFGTGSLGEAPLAATLRDGRVIAGTVDRLLVGEDRVEVIDFKTGRVPASDAAIPASHRAQMAAYVEALAVIFPDREIRASLLYTSGPRLFEVGA
jgi:ATP-dependent helicase/nuclease subunit A